MRILSITSPDLSNGIGCRVTVWVAGCSHCCPGCHNKFAQNYSIGDDLSDDTVRKNIYNAIEQELDKPFIQGITFSGGDPLDQPHDRLEELCALVDYIRDKYGDTKDIWIYSGDTYENLIKDELKFRILMCCDVLVDGPFIQSQQKVGLPFRGSDNQRIIDIQNTLKHNNSKIIEVEL